MSKTNHINWHMLGRIAYFAIFPEIRVDDRVHISCYSFCFSQALLSIEFSHAIIPWRVSNIDQGWY